MTPAQEQFALALSQGTGLDPYVTRAWTVSESAASDTGTNRSGGTYNFLNYNVYPGHYGVNFPDPIAAANAMTQAIRSEPNWKYIAASRSQSPINQLVAIASAPWAGGHYGGNGQNLFAAYNSVSPQKLTPAQVTQAEGFVSSVVKAGPGGSVSVKDLQASGALPSADAGGEDCLATIPIPIPGVDKLCFHRSWGRALLGGICLVGGGALLIGGLVLIAGRNLPVSLPALPRQRTAAQKSNDKLEEEYAASQAEDERNAAAERRQAARETRLAQRHGRIVPMDAAA